MLRRPDSSSLLPPAACRKPSEFGSKENDVQRHDTQIFPPTPTAFTPIQENHAQKTIIGAAAAAVFGLLLAGCSGTSADSPESSQDDSSAQESISIVYSVDVEPYVITEDGVKSGLQSDLFAHVEEQHGFTAEWTLMDLAGLIPALESGRGDAIIDYLYITDERKKAVDFTQPLFGWSLGLVVPESTTEQYGDLNALKGLTVGVLAGSVQYEDLTAVGGVDIKTYDDYASMVIDISAERLHAGLVDPPQIGRIIQTQPDANVKFDESFKIGENNYVGWAVRKGDTELLEKLDDTITKLKEDGTMRELVTKYLGEQVEVPPAS